MKGYTSGQQPCQNFQQQKDGNAYATWGNVHECFCGHDVGKYCPLTVSWCENCNQDHHENGYENCICGGKGWNQ